MLGERFEGARKDSCPKTSKSCSSRQTLTAPSYVSIETLLDPHLIIQLGVAPVRVDVQSHFGTMSFAAAWRTRVDAKFGSVSAHYLGRAELIAEKTFFNRPQDRADVAMLQSKRSAVTRDRRAK